MIKLESITVGSDAEMPVRIIGGEFIPVTGLLGGTKENPRPLGREAGYYVQEDNVNAEFNIPAAHTPQEFCNAIFKAKNEVQRALPPWVEAVIQAATEYRAEFLNIPAVLEFGCNPDLNVYTGQKNPIPNAKNKALRTASAHIHVGWEKPTNEDRLRMVKMMDLVLAVAFLRYDNMTRRELYGRAGAFRAKEYGIEHRVLGNFWLDDMFPGHVFAGVHKAAQKVNEGVELTKLDTERVIRAINEGNREDAMKVSKKYGVVML